MLLAAGVLSPDRTWAGAPPAGAGCLSDATRAASAQGRIADDQRGHLEQLLASATDAAKRGDGMGCRKAADEALQAAGLPALAPILLSTSMVGEQRGVQAQVPAAPRPGAPAGSTSSASTAATPVAPPSAGPPPPAAPAQTAAAAAPAPAEPGPAPAPSDAWLVTARDLLGKRVVSTGDNGRELGIIQNLIIEGANGGQLRYVVIRPPGPLGTTVLPPIGSPREVVVPLAALHFSARGDMARLDATAEKLRDAPGFRDADVERLQADKEWQQSIAVFYGVAATAAPQVQATAPPAPPRQPTAQAASVQQASAAPGDPAHGQSVAKVCSACHSLDKGGPIRVGPPLYGVDGRPVASVPGFSYSAALKGKGGKWDDATLNAFLKNPRSYAPGTRMAYPGISNDHDRADIVAFLDTLK